jgi:hypothetical protein
LKGLELEIFTDMDEATHRLANAGRPEAAARLP